MTKPNERKIQALKNAAKEKQLLAYGRVKKALFEMEKEHIPITFQSVAKYAGVSKTILYANSKFSEQIKAARDKSTILQRVINQEKAIASRDQQITLLTKRNQALLAEIKMLKTQLEVAYGEIYKNEK